MRTIRMALYAMSLVCIPVMLLQGCAAAPMLVAGATTGFTGYQTMQMSGESDVNIRFSNDAGAQGTPLRSVKTIGVWPSIPEMTTLAEKLQSTNAFRRVITPYKINQSLRAMGVQSIDPAMTVYEKQRLFKKVAGRTGADGIIYVTPKGESSDTRMFGLARPEYAMHYQIDVYSPRSNSIVWSEMLDVAIAIGSTTPSDHVIVGAAVDAVVNRMQVLAGKATLTTSNSSTAALSTDSSMTCNDMRAEISVLDRTIQNYHTQNADTTMQQYPTSAGTQMATQAATDMAAQTVPGAIPYLQPLLATAKGFLDKNMPGEKKEIAEAQARKDYLSGQYNQKCSVSRSRADATTQQIQARLNQLGYPCGSADGIAGKNTLEAIRRFQTDRGLPVDGRVSEELLAMLKREQ